MIIKSDFIPYRNGSVDRRSIIEAQGMKHHLNWSVTIVSAPQEAVIEQMK
jgi:hypothetical protein